MGVPVEDVRVFGLDETVRFLRSMRDAWRGNATRALYWMGTASP